jgi:hypothetical protein
MGMIHEVVRSLSVYKGSGKMHSRVIDLGDAFEVHNLLKVSNITGGGSLTVKMLHSIDGTFWEGTSGTDFAAATAPGAETKSATGSLFRYAQFEYELTGGTNPTATFEVVLFAKTRGFAG